MISDNYKNILTIVNIIGMAIILTLLFFVCMCVCVCGRDGADNCWAIEGS